MTKTFYLCEGQDVISISQAFLLSNSIIFGLNGLRFALQIDIVDLLRAYIRGEFLVLSVVLGYLLFFLFFYPGNRDYMARRHWDSLQWSERFFLGFLFGWFILLLFQAGLNSLLNYLNQRIWLAKPLDPVSIWFWSSVAILLVAVLLRLEVKGPVHGSDGLKKIIMILGFRNLFFWLPAYVVIFLVVLGYFSSILYSLIGSTLQALWFGLSGAFFSFVLWSIWIPACIFIMFSAASDFRGSLSAHIRTFFISIYWNLSYLIESSSTLSGEAKALFARNREIIAVLVVVIFLGFITPLADAQFGLISPRIEYVETRVGDNYDVVGNIGDYKILIEITKTFFISAPYVWIIRNVTISNPSNYSYSDGSTWGGISSRLIGSHAGLSEIKGLGNRVTAFNVTLQPQPQRHNIGLEINYRDRLNCSLIDAMFGPITEVGNNTFQREIQITIRNQLSKRVCFQPLPVVTEFEGQMIQASCTRDGEPVDWCHYDEKHLEIWLPDLDPGEQLNLVLTVEFSR